MTKILKSHHPVRHAKSFKYAFQGIWHALLNEPNFRVQILIASACVLLGAYLGINNVEWALLTISMGFLVSAELVNTVVEEFIDHLIKEYDVGAKIIKDLSAGFVLIAAITASIVFCFILGPKVIGML